MPARDRTRRIPGPAMPLIERDDSVLVVIDLQPRFWGDRLGAVDSPFGAHPSGLQRLRDLGVELIHCKGAYYDWARTLADAVAFEAANPRLASPPGFSL